MRKAFLTFCMLLAFGLNAAFAQADWKLVYENDKDGNAVSGKLEDLISAIRAGKQVRIYFIMGGGGNSVEHAADVKFLTVMTNSEGQYVMGQIDPILSQNPDFANADVTFREGLEWSLIASTTGRNDQMYQNRKTGEVLQHSIQRWGTKWFVQE